MMGGEERKVHFLGAHQMFNFLSKTFTLDYRLHMFYLCVFSQLVLKHSVPLQRIVAFSTKIFPNEISVSMSLHLLLAALT